MAIRLMGVCVCLCVIEFAQHRGRFDLLALFVGDFFSVVRCVYGLDPLRNSVRDFFECRGVVL